MIFLQEILISPHNSSSPACHIMYFVYKLNKQGDNIQPWHIPFPILIHSVVPCPIITVASWPVYIQTSQKTGKVVWYSHLFMNFQVCLDSQSQMLQCSQWSNSRCFPIIPLLSLWYFLQKCIFISSAHFSVELFAFCYWTVWVFYFGN